MGRCAVCKYVSILPMRCVYEYGDTVGVVGTLGLRCFSLN